LGDASTVLKCVLARIKLNKPGSNKVMPSTPQAPGRVAGIDFGNKRIGIAVCDAEQRIASPYATYLRRRPAVDAQYFRKLVANESITAFVVGLPVHMSGDESRMSQAAREFGSWLASETGLPVHYVDERYSSLEADVLLIASEVPRKKKRARRDQLAALTILNNYLEAR
jgi:putative Holliday junction resolvase